MRITTGKNNEDKMEEENEELYRMNRMMTTMKMKIWNVKEKESMKV